VLQLLSKISPDNVGQPVEILMNNERFQLLNSLVQFGTFLE
jgi:hypothetical protein